MENVLSLQFYSDSLLPTANLASLPRGSLSSFCDHTISRKNIRYDEIGSG
jgi:hypothetical protein